MSTVDHTQLSSWMDAEAEGLLGSAEKTRLTEHLGRLAESDAAAAERLATERRCWASLHRVLAEDRTEVRSCFCDDVMASVDPGLWRSTRTRAWRLPLAAMLIFALGAAWSLVGVGAEHPVIGTGAAVADFLQSTVLAGSGVVVASWRGAGMGLEELFAGSSVNLAAFAFLVLCVNLLFFSLLRRRVRPATEAASTAEKGSAEGDVGHSP